MVRVTAIGGSALGTATSAGLPEGRRAGDDRLVSALQTPLCRLLGIEYPICSVGMGMGAGPELAAAVSNAGGFGVLGTHGEPGDGIRRLVARTRATSSARPRRPWG
jgi:hypothetical protein